MKKVAVLEKKIVGLESQNANINEAFEMFKKEQESSPI
jgi:hypothetical protein